MVIRFRLEDYPRYQQEHANDGCATWGHSLRSAGYTSVTIQSFMDGVYYVMDEEEFTWFALRWA